MSGASRFALMAIMAGSLLPAAASAEELSRIVAGEMPTVRDRYEGLGMRAGQFWILPTVETGYFFDSNVFGEAVKPNSGSGIYVSPQVAVRSDFGRHALNMRVGLDHYEYFDFSSQSRTNVNGELDGRIDVRRDLVILGGVRGGLFQQTAHDLEYPLPGAVFKPGDYTTVETWGSINKAFNRLSVSAGVAYKMYDYDDIDGFDQDYRDSDVVTVGGRMGYLFSPGYRVFGDFRYNWRDYDNGFISDSEGWRALGGVEFEITHLLWGTVAVGYMEQDYRNPLTPTARGFSYHAGLVWNPTRLMTVYLDADRTVEDSAITGRGRLQDAVELKVDYEVLRNVMLTTMAGIAYNDYEASPLEDFRYKGGVQLDYRMNRFLSVGARYDYTYSDFEGPGFADWDRHLVGLYAKARF